MDDRGAGVKHLVNIFRRLHRIFAHAWFQHRGVFWQVEGQTGLYVLFKTVCDIYELLPAENYKLPPEAEGLEPTQEAKASIPSILKSEAPPSNNVSLPVDEDSSFINVGRTNNLTRRHIRSSPSTGSAVTTVLESDEEEPDVTQQLGNMHISTEEEPEIPPASEANPEPTPEPESEPEQEAEVQVTVEPVADPTSEEPEQTQTAESEVGEVKELANKEPEHENQKDEDEEAKGSESELKSEEMPAAAAKEAVKEPEPESDETLAAEQSNM